jgi:hypothetical protein
LAAIKPNPEQILAEMQKRRSTEYEQQKLQVARVLAQWTFAFSLLASVLVLWLARSGGSDWTVAAVRALGAAVILAFVGVSLMNPLGHHLVPAPKPVTEEDLPEELRPKKSAAAQTNTPTNPASGQAASASQANSDQAKTSAGGNNAKNEAKNEAKAEAVAEEKTPVGAAV